MYPCILYPISSAPWQNLPRSPLHASSLQTSDEDSSNCGKIVRAVSDVIVLYRILCNYVVVECTFVCTYTESYNAHIFRSTIPCRRGIRTISQTVTEGWLGIDKLYSLELCFSIEIMLFPQCGHPQRQRHICRPLCAEEARSLRLGGRRLEQRPAADPPRLPTETQETWHPGRWLSTASCVSGGAISPTVTRDRRLMARWTPRVNSADSGSSPATVLWVPRTLKNTLERVTGRTFWRLQSGTLQRQGCWPIVWSSDLPHCLSPGKLHRLLHS